MKKKWRLGFIARTRDPRILRAARNGSRRFSIVRHVGRKSGPTYESVIIVAPVPEGSVAELTYGREW